MDRRWWELWRGWDYTRSPPECIRSWIRLFVIHTRLSAIAPEFDGRQAEIGKAKIGIWSAGGVWACERGGILPRGSRFRLLQYLSGYALMISVGGILLRFLHFWLFFFFFFFFFFVFLFIFFLFFNLFFIIIIIFFFFFFFFSFFSFFLLAKRVEQSSVATLFLKLVLKSFRGHLCSPLPPWTLDPKPSTPTSKP